MKKKSHKRMMDGGMAGPGYKGGSEDKMASGRKPRGGGMPSKDQIKRTMPIDPRMNAMPKRPPIGTMPIDRPTPRMSPEMMDRMGRAMAMQRGNAPMMRGGGLARKGVGMALAAGGLAKRAGGCAKRGVGRGKMV